MRYRDEIEEGLAVYEEEREEELKEQAENAEIQRAILADIAEVKLLMELEELGLRRKAG